MCCSSPSWLSLHVSAKHASLSTHELALFSLASVLEVHGEVPPFVIGQSNDHTFLGIVSALAGWQRLRGGVPLEDTASWRFLHP